MIVYHGTSARIARKILRSHRLKRDSWVTLRKKTARDYAKKNKRGRIIALEIPDEWCVSENINLKEGYAW